jgi:hypothetical protein
MGRHVARIGEKMNAYMFFLSCTVTCAAVCSSHRLLYELSDLSLVASALSCSAAPFAMQ